MKHNLKFNEYDLAHCSSCGGAEGSLTETDCPVERMTREQESMVYSQGWDFIEGEGFVNKNGRIKDER